MNKDTIPFVSPVIPSDGIASVIIKNIFIDIIDMQSAMYVSLMKYRICLSRSPLDISAAKKKAKNLDTISSYAILTFLYDIAKYKRIIVASSRKAVQKSKLYL